MSDFTIIEHNSIDSTNNYAMLLIDANKAQHGLTITALSQTNGKGQRGNTWVDRPGESLLMSVIVQPGRPIGEQFAFSGAIAAAIARFLQNLYKNCDIRIKWPNDIIVNDKKAGGILIENILRGSQWVYSIIGLGLNIGQESMPQDLPHATSLRIASGQNLDPKLLVRPVSEHIIAAISVQSSAGMVDYNQLLYKIGQKQKFSEHGVDFWATIISVNTDGILEVKKEDGTLSQYSHGQITWIWE